MYRMMSCSSCRACEAAFGCVAVVKPELAVHQTNRVSRTHDCYAAERSLAGSAAATKIVSISHRSFQQAKKNGALTKRTVKP